MTTAVIAPLIAYISAHIYKACAGKVVLFDFFAYPGPYVDACVIAHMQTYTDTSSDSQSLFSHSYEYKIHSYNYGRTNTFNQTSDGTTT